MCVILQIEPGTVVPADKLARACDINKHGHGIAYVHKGELKLIRSVANNDPKEIAATLERLRSHRVFLHLRHATVGPVTLANNHPMIVWHHA